MCVLEARRNQIKKDGVLYVVSAVHHLGFKLESYSDQNPSDLYVPDSPDDEINFTNFVLDYDWIKKHILLKKAETVVRDDTLTRFNVSYAMVYVGYRTREKINEYNALSSEVKAALYKHRE